MKNNMDNHWENDPNAFKPIPDGPILLDFSGCQWEYDMHRVLKQAFGFPDYYGHNWDALWDCLDCLFNDRRLVKIVGLQSLSKDMERGVKIMLEVFEDVHAENPNVMFQVIS